jgi:hypothetical protein
MNLLNNLEDENTSEDLTDDKIFKDIPNDYKYYNEIKYFKENSIIS